MNSDELIEKIKNSEKLTPVKAYIQAKDRLELNDVLYFNSDKLFIIIDEWSKIEQILTINKPYIEDYYIEGNIRNSAIKQLDVKSLNARIEHGAIIREDVKIGNNAIIMMGAIINIGSKIGDYTMIDMGAILGAKVEVGSNCHIGAGAVLAGVIEPPSAQSVVVEDNVLIGANAVILEGCRVGHNSVVGAGAVVIEDVLPNSVVGGVPAKLLKMKDQKTEKGTKMIESLRKI